VAYSAIHIMVSVHSKNISILVGGTAAAQIVSILSLPILSRIYTPAEYGVLGIYMAISSLFIGFSTLQYSQAIMLPEDESTAMQLTSLCVFSVLGMSLLTTVFLLFLGEMLLTYINISEYLWVLYLAPVSMLVSGLSNAFTVLANRHKRYQKITVSRVVAAVTTVSISISLSYFSSGPVGLIVGAISGQVMGCLILIMAVKNIFVSNLPHITIQSIKTVAAKYRRFPIYSLPSEVINLFTSQLPVYVLAVFVGPSVVGLFDRSRQLLELPIKHISGAVGEVFRQRAARTYEIDGNCIELFRETFLQLSKLAIIPFLVIVFWAPDIFAFVLGDDWRDSGAIAQVLALMYALKFIVSPLSYLYLMAKKQREDFYLHLLMLSSSPVALYVGYSFFSEDGVAGALSLYSITYAFIYLIYLIRSRKFSYGVRVSDKGSTSDN
jgi:O-antigen/teichoic acid export membrane protein